MMVSSSSSCLFQLPFIISFIICQQLSRAEMHVGSAINLLSRYGYLSISMRVVPRNDTDRSWIFREPTVDIFTNISMRRNEKKEPRSNTFRGDFHMEFCENVPQLLQAYFREFSMERLEKPWTAFTGSWSKSIIARNFGLSTSYINGPSEFCYVLVRVARHRDVTIMSEMELRNFTLQDTVQREVDDVKIGDSVGLMEFIRSFGSHYITSYITGNSLYQVFVYDPSHFQVVREKLKQKGIMKMPSQELIEYFSPIHARQVGRILSASGNTSVEQWARRKLGFYPLQFESLLKLHSSPKLLYELDRILGNEALLKLDLKTLAPIFKDERKKHWFQEVIDNQLKLWEVNM